LKTEDVHLVHRLWLNITHEEGLETLHHHDILTEALTRFAREYAGHDRQEILRELRNASGVTVTTRALGDSGQAPAAPETEKLILRPPAPIRPDPDLDKGKKGGGPSTPPVVGP
jgi:hypothetical protein